MPSPEWEFSVLFLCFLNFIFFIYFWLHWVFIAEHGLLTVVASLTVETGSRRTGLAALKHVGSSQTRDWTHVPCIARRILNHWTTREAQYVLS